MGGREGHFMELDVVGGRDAVENLKKHENQGLIGYYLKKISANG